jgi:hypothetical protein
MRNPWKLTSFVLITLLAATVGGDAIVNRAAAERQPKMQQALDELRAAATSLEAADHDKGGHRAKALELTNSAIDEVERGIEWDRKH